MGYDTVFLKLLKWDDQESFFRDYYHGSEPARKALLERPDIDPEWKRNALDPGSIDPRETEERFFSSDRNVSLIRHPRYLPYFEHRHMFFEMVYVVTGSCDQRLNGENMRLTQGDLCLLAPDVPHGVCVFDDSVVLNIIIRSSTFMDIFLNAVRDKSSVSSFFLNSMYNREKTPYLLFRTGEDEVLLHYILDMYEEQLRDDGYSDRIICSLLTIFFSQLTRRHSQDTFMPEARKARTGDEDAIITAIMARYSSITLNELAEELHYSVPYCSKLVKRLCGLPFSELITRVRLQQAATLLKTTQLRVEAIGEEVGYQNTETFIRAFRRVYSSTPSRYRQEKA